MKISDLLNFREHFSARIFLTFSFLIVIVTLAFTVFFYRYQSSSLTEKTESEGELLASLLAYNARLGVYTENADLLSAPVNGILENPEVLSVAVYTADGKTLALQNRPGSRLSPDIEKWNAGIGQSLKKSTQPLRLTNDDNFIIWTRVALKPIITAEDAVYLDAYPTKQVEQIIGSVRVVMDGRQLRKHLHVLLFDSILIGIISLIIGSMIAYLISGRITKPLNKLTDGVKDFSCGKECKEIIVETGDEIGNLASAFNDMVDSLKKREAEKEELEEKLRHSQKMEAIGTLAGGVAHDFNNILMAINGYGALIQFELDEGSKLWSYADQIIRAGERAANLTQRLLAFTRKQIISPRPIILDEIVRNIDKMLARLITEDIELKFHLEAADNFVMADADQMDQVLLNLVTNARDSMPHGGAIIIATCVVTLEDDFVKRHDQQNGGEYLLITVSDNGVGINEDIKERIFDPFFTTKEVGKGTGLGLSMVYGIVKQHNGIIELDSEAGKGTTFRIYLPLIEPVIKKEQGKSPVFLQGNMETILVAEDDTAVMGLLKGLLEKNGYNVITATNGEEAVRKFIDHRDSIRLILLDVIMPRKNGKEVYDEIIGIRSDIKAIFMSGYTNDIIDWKGALQEDINLISKPVRPGDLLLKLREVLEKG
ncbi:MAG: ATP-binding protein [Geobacteraceae bacterium]|jgi:signal transduction histidine kinase/CheY-like chemotaxis protein